MKTTDDFIIGDQVVVLSGPVCNGMRGEVIAKDAYTVEVRFPTVTDEMKEFEDLKTGCGSFMPYELKVSELS